MILNWQPQHLELFYTSLVDLRDEQTLESVDCASGEAWKRQPHEWIVSLIPSRNIKIPSLEAWLWSKNSSCCDFSSQQQVIEYHRWFSMNFWAFRLCHCGRLRGTVRERERWSYTSTICSHHAEPKRQGKEEKKQMQHVMWWMCCYCSWILTFFSTFHCISLCTFRT